MFLYYTRAIQPKQQLECIYFSCLFKEGKQIFNDFSVAIDHIKSKRVEIVQSIRAGVDLDSTKNRSCLLETSSSRRDNITQQEILGFVQGVWELLHSVVGVIQSLSVGKDEFLDGALLEIREGLDLGGHGGTTVGDPCDVVGGSNGASAATVNQSNSLTFDLSDESVLCDTNVGGENDQAVSIIGNVSGHGTETSVTGEGESGKTTKVKVIAVDFDQIILQTTSKFVTAKGGGQQSVLSSVSLLGQDINNLGLELSVRDGSRESVLDKFVELGVFNRVVVRGDDQLDLFESTEFAGLGNRQRGGSSRVDGSRLESASCRNTGKQDSSRETHGG